MFQSATGYFNKENGEKYLIIDLTHKYEEVSSAIKSEIETNKGGRRKNIL